MTLARLHFMVNIELKTIEDKVKANVFTKLLISLQVS